MIAGTALAAWLADREAQERSYGRVDACAKKWGSHPLMTELERAVSEMRPRTVEGLLDAARRFIDRTGDIDAMLSEFIATSRLDPFFRPPFHPLSNEIMSSLLLYHHPDLSIALGVTGVDMLAAKKAGKRGATSINFTGYVSLMRFQSRVPFPSNDPFSFICNSHIASLPSHLISLITSYPASAEFLKS